MGYLGEELPWHVAWSPSFPSRSPGSCQEQLRMPGAPRLHGRCSTAGLLSLLASTKLFTFPSCSDSHKPQQGKLQGRKKLHIYFSKLKVGV